MTDAVQHGTGRLAAAGAVLLGLAVPSLVAGRVPIAVAIGLGLALLFAASPWRAVLSDAKRRLAHPVAIAAAVTLALWLVSTLLSPELFWPLQIWGYVAGSLLAASFLHWFFQRDEAARRLTMKALLVGGLFFLGVAVLALFVWWEVLTPFRTRPFESFHHVRQALLGFGSALPLLMAASLYAGWRLGGRWNWAGLAVAAMALATLIALPVKSPWLGIAAGVAAVGLGLLMARLGVWGARAVAVALAVCAALLAWYVIANLPALPYQCEPLTIPDWALDAHRQVIWQFSLENAVQRPWFGFGIDRAGDLPHAKQLVPCFGTVEYLPSHSHSWAVELFVETGGLGLTATVVTLVLFAMLLIRRLARGEGAAVAALAIAGAYWGSGLVNFSIWSAWWMWCFLLFTALVLADPSGRRPSAGA